MDFKKILLFGAILIGVQIAMGLGVFVTPTEMYTYAASQDDIEIIHAQLVRIEQKLDKIIMGY